MSAYVDTALKIYKLCCLTSVFCVNSWLPEHGVFFVFLAEKAILRNNTQLFVSTLRKCVVYSVKMGDESKEERQDNEYAALEVSLFILVTYLNENNT